MKKIVSVLVIIMLLCTCFVLIANDDINVQGIPGENGEENFDNFYDYFWFNITDNLSYVVHNDSIWGEGDEVIRKGRSFGTPGENWTADYILKELTKLGLENVQLIKLGPIEGYPEWEYTSKVETIDFNLTCNSPNWTFTNDGHIPKNETYTVPSGWVNNSHTNFLYWTMDYNNTFNNAKLVPKNYTEKWSLRAFEIGHYNITNITILNEFFYICGFAEYIPINQTLPNQQIGKVFLLEEENGCENQLDNLTDISAAIIIHNNTQGGSNYFTNYNFSNLSIQCVRINRTENNMTTVIEMLENENIIMVENILDNQTLTFIHNFSYLYEWWPSDPNEHFFIIGGDKNIVNVYDKSKTIWFWNLKLKGERAWCNGLIIYDNRIPDVHFEEATMRSWMGRAYSPFISRVYHFPFFSQPGMQIFSVNKSVGEFLENNANDPDCTISGYFEQEFIKEDHENWTAGVDAYNVAGNITIDKSPDDKIIIISNRFDSWYNECPGDSGAGTGIVMGIAKYIKEKNIKPKYNLTFLFTTGEEYSMRGAWHYSHTHPENQFKIIRWIGVDQLGFTQPEDPIKNANLTFRCSKMFWDMPKTINIAEKSDYKTITGYGLESEWVYDLNDLIPAWFASGTDDVAWVWPNRKQPNCDTICIHKTDEWYRHHRVGINHTEGDSMKYMDRTDLNTTFNIIWNITKYYCFDPDCWFKDISYTPWDSNNDDFDDSVNITFTANTSFPHDRLMVKAVLISQNHPILCQFREKESFIVTPTSGADDMLSITLPKCAPKGYYQLRVYLFNSTGEVNTDVENPFDIEYLNTLYANTTFVTDEFYLHPPNSPPDTPDQPSGDTSIKVGELALYTTNTNDSEGDEIWYQWRWDTSVGIPYYTRWITGGPYNSGENCVRYIGWLFPGTYKVKVHAKDNFFNPNVMSDWSPELTVTVTQSQGGSSSWNNELLGTFSSTVLLIEEQTSCNGFAPGVFVETGLRDSLSWNWSFGDGNYSNEENVVHNYSNVGNYTVNLTITNNEGYMYNCTTNISVLILKADFNTSNVLQPNVTIFFNDTSDGYYNLTNWTWDFGDGNISYQQNTNHTYPISASYNVSLTVKDDQNNSHTCYKNIFVESVLPGFVSVMSSPSVVGFGSDVTIVADFFDNQSMVNNVVINMVYPDNSSENFTMGVNVSSPYDYMLFFNDTWQVGDYNYSVYVLDNAGNVNCTSGFNFTVSAQANISVCTKKDEYGDDEYVELTDPPSEKPLEPIGYELLDNGSVLRLWNRFDSYYFNTSNGLQFTNHYNKYWSHNVLMLGYYNNDQWNLIYRTDELSGFNKNIVTDNETYINITLWKDLTYGGYDFRLAIRYYLGVDDNELTVIPYIKNLGIEIPYVLGFAWELMDIQVDMTPVGDYIEINGTSYFLNGTIDEVYANLDLPQFYIFEDFSDNRSESLYLRWDQSLNYRVWVKSRTGQYNAPVTLGIKIGTLNVGQEKFTKLFWHDASEVAFYFNGYDTGFPGETWLTNPGYMADGNESTFASTNINDDVELLNKNSYNKTNFGTIVKVELRCKGYRSGFGGGSKNIILRPVFVGGDGNNHSFTTGTVAGWSSWFNITGDTNAPGNWSWTDIDFLDCDVESDLSSGYTLYCSKVEVRVTYNNAPVVSDPFPAHGSIDVGLYPMLNITVSDVNGDCMNVTWYSNCSGSWQVFGINHSVYNGTYYRMFSNASENGKWWYWKVKVDDGTTNVYSSVFRFYTGVESKIKNSGSTNISGYLFICVQFNDSGEWVLDDDTVNETSMRTITVGGQLGLDTFFNGLVNTNDLSHGSGTYRVYAAFRNPEGDVLICSDDSLLEESYEFNVT